MAIGLDWPRWTPRLLLILASVPVGVLAGLNPKLAIFVALGLAFVVLVFADLTAGVVGFTVLTFLGLLPTIGGSLLSLPKLAGLLLALSWLAAFASRRYQGIDFFSDLPTLTFLGLTFLAWVALSTVWAESHHLVITSLYRYSLNLMLIPIVYAAIRKREHALAITAAFVGGATIAAAYGLVVQPSASAAGAAELDRISGTVGDPNELAAVLVAGMILAIGLAQTAVRSPILRLAAYFSAGLCAITIVLTLSRGGLVAMAAAIFAGIVLGGRARPVYTVVAFLLVLGTVTYFGALAPSSARDRVTQADGGTGRTDIWRVAWRAVEAKPVVGLGGGNFPVSSVHYLLQPGSLKRSDLIVQRSEVTHNMYLQVLAELGIIGAALFLGLVGGCLAAAVLAARRFSELGDDHMELLSRAIAVAMVGLLAADFFLSGQYGKQLWLLLSFGPGMYGLALHTAVAGAEDRQALERSSP